MRKALKLYIASEVLFAINARCIPSMPHDKLTFSAAFDEETVSHLHDVGLVNCCDFVPSIVAGVLESILCNPCTGNPGDDLPQECSRWP